MSDSSSLTRKRKTHQPNMTWNKVQSTDDILQQIQADEEQQQQQQTLDTRQLEEINFQLQQEFNKHEIQHSSLSRHYMAEQPKFIESSDTSPPDKPIVSPESNAGSTKAESVYEKNLAAKALLAIRKNSTHMLAANYVKPQYLPPEFKHSISQQNAQQHDNLLASINELSRDLLKKKKAQVKPPLAWGGKVETPQQDKGSIPLHSIRNLQSTFSGRFPALESHKSSRNSKAGSQKDDHGSNPDDSKFGSMPRLTLPASKKSPLQKSPAIINNLNSGNLMKSYNDDIIPPNMYDIVEVDGKKKRVFNAMKRELDKKFEKGTVKRLQRYMRQAYQDGTVCSPKWKNFSGLKIRMFDKQRLNNAIWRTWFHVHNNYNDADDKLFVTAPDVSTDDLKSDNRDGPSTKLLENTIVSGQYWRRQVHVLAEEYKSWREKEIQTKKLMKTNKVRKPLNANDYLKTLGIGRRIKEKVPREPLLCNTNSLTPGLKPENKRTYKISTNSSLKKSIKSHHSRSHHSNSSKSSNSSKNQLKPNTSNQNSNLFPHETLFNYEQELKTPNVEHCTHDDMADCDCMAENDDGCSSHPMHPPVIYASNGVNLPLADNSEQWPPSTDTIYYQSYDDGDLKLHTKTYQTIDDPYCLDNDLKSIIEELFPDVQPDENLVGQSDLTSLPLSTVDNAEYRPEFPESKMASDQQLQYQRSAPTMTQRSQQFYPSAHPLSRSAEATTNLFENTNSNQTHFYNETTPSKTRLSNNQLANNHPKNQPQNNQIQSDYSHSQKNTPRNRNSSGNSYQHNTHNNTNQNTNQNTHQNTNQNSQHPPSFNNPTHPYSFFGDTSMMRDIKQHNTLPLAEIMDVNLRNISRSVTGPTSTPGLPVNNEFVASPESEAQKNIEFGKLFSWGSHLPKFIANPNQHQDNEIETAFRLNYHGHPPSQQAQSYHPQNQSHQTQSHQTQSNQNHSNQNQSHQNQSHQIQSHQTHPNSVHRDQPHQNPRNPSQNPHSSQNSNSSPHQNNSSFQRSTSNPRRQLSNSPPYNKGIKRHSSGMMLPPAGNRSHYSGYPEANQISPAGNPENDQNQDATGVPGGFLSTIQSPANDHFNRNVDACSVTNETLSVGSAIIPENLGPPIPYDPLQRNMHHQINNTSNLSRYRPTSMSSNFSQPDVCSPRSGMNVPGPSNQAQMGQNGQMTPNRNSQNGGPPIAKISKNDSFNNCSEGNHSMSNFSQNNHDSGSREPYNPGRSPPKSGFNPQNSSISHQTYAQLQPFRQNSSENYTNNQGFQTHGYTNSNNGFNSHQNNNNSTQNNSPPADSNHSKNNPSNLNNSRHNSGSDQNFSQNSNLNDLMNSPTIKTENCSPILKGTSQTSPIDSKSSPNLEHIIGAKSTQSFFEMFKDEFTVNNKESRKATLSLAKSYMDAASRRNDQKHAFDRLEGCLSEITVNRPNIFGSFCPQDRPLGGGKMSKSALLINASQEITAINDERRGRHSEILEMKIKIAKVREEIGEIQCKLPSSNGGGKGVLNLKADAESSEGSGIDKTPTEVFQNLNLAKMKGKITDAFSEKVVGNWRYYYFSKLFMKPLLAQYWTTANFNNRQTWTTSIDDWRKSRMQGDILHEQLQHELIHLCKMDGVQVDSGPPENQRLQNLALSNADNIFFPKHT